jgi:hypothetical protein
MSAKKKLEAASKDINKYGLIDKDYLTSAELMIAIQKSLPNFVKVKISQAH